MALTPKINIPKQFSQMRVGLTPRHAEGIEIDTEQSADRDLPAAVVARMAQTVSDAKNKGVKLS